MMAPVLTSMMMPVPPFLASNVSSMLSMFFSSEAWTRVSRVSTMS